MPWDTLFLYNLRVQSLTETYNAISSDGVNMNVTINTRFRLQRDSVPALHQVVGPDYAKILGPQIASEMREDYVADTIRANFPNLGIGETLKVVPLRVAGKAG